MTSVVCVLLVMLHVLTCPANSYNDMEFDDVHPSHSLLNVLCMTLLITLNGFKSLLAELRCLMVSAAA